ncbi:uncharacterized protein LOC108666452 [Hyalella azteca]|uniref:Uncharacterized protein LOC108666452 n=1 Tax=Hyalella azteca TaxID=294128 RepID=A0A8B7N699_HYAAZ|nr:uncharacterized protein LOC108666452 [Hyalella azteca]
MTDGKSLLLVVVVTVMVCIVSSNEVSTYDQLLETYASLKVNMACLTPEAVQQWKNRVFKSLEWCEELTRETQEQTQLSDSVFLIQPTDWNRIFAQFFSVAFRQKRGAEFTAEKIKNLKKKLLHKIETFRCFMRKMRITDNNNKVSVSSYTENFRNIGLPSALFNSIADGILECKHFSVWAEQSLGNDDFGVLE